MTRKMKWAFVGVAFLAFLLGAGAGAVGVVAFLGVKTVRGVTGGDSASLIPQMRDVQRLMAAQEQLRRLTEQMKVYSNSDEPDWMMPPGNQESQARELERVLGELLGESKPEPAKPETGKPPAPETEPRKQER